MNEEDIVKLIEYAELEGTEFGEVCRQLLAIWFNSSYISEEFKEALIKEMKQNLAEYESRTKIVERTETFTYRELEWD